MVYGMLVLWYVLSIVILLTFLVRIFFGVLCIVDVAHVECAYILNLLYSHVEFNFFG
jgi:hypothetical protein